MHNESERAATLVLAFDEIRTPALVGGKGAHLAELSRIRNGVVVPPGFCVTTLAFDSIIAEVDEQLLARLARVKVDDREAIATLSEEVRRAIEAVSMPREIASVVARAVERLDSLGDARAAYAVRSSATAEDLPTASFAGQQDTYLNVIGVDAVLAHIKKCWASLFTERAVTYRVKNGFVDQTKVRMAVVVQRMVFPKSAGVLFTAHPIHGNRKVSSIEASFGLGESFVSGRVNADVYEVRDDHQIVRRVVGKKELAIVAASAGGTEEREIDDPQKPALTDAQVVQLAQLGRKIEKHFGRPQDIEWCLLEDDSFAIVQSRPITTLFPIPKSDDGANHIYLSVGHQQMMTEAMKPLGLSFWKLIAARPMDEAGSRVFVDVTSTLASPKSRSGIMALVRKSDPLMTDAMQQILDRANFLPEVPADAAEPPLAALLKPTPPLEADPHVVPKLVARFEASLAQLKRDIQSKSGVELLDFIRDDIKETTRGIVDPESMQVIMSAMRATWSLNEQLPAWLGGEKNEADALAQSVPNNVTSEMGLALLDVADAIRPHKEVVAFLKKEASDDFLESAALANLEGGQEARDAINGWLDKYGMRCPGEIDITRPRFRERPTMLLPTLLANIETFEKGEAKRRFDRGNQEAAKKEEDLMRRVSALPDGGEEKAAETKRMIDRIRTFMGYREYPKYGMINRTFVYKQALLAEAERLVQTKVLAEKEDIFFLTFEELHDVVRSSKVKVKVKVNVNERLIDERREAFAFHCTLTPPRVLTSEGESIMGSYHRAAADLPPGALIGLAVSAGTIEGRARIILDIAKANLEPGDILVTRFTDPSWTPLFVAIKGLVTEVGGLMTHGAVIAREYGLPAVVGVENATTMIQDGTRIRVNGTEGFIEIL